MKKIWKYVLYAAVIIFVLYIVFRSTRERFASVNPLPTAADLAALKESFEKLEKTRVSANSITMTQMAGNILKTAPESIKSMIRFSRANIIPLLPYNVVKSNTNPDGSDNLDYWTLVIMPMYKDMLILPLAYAVKQQSSPPTLPAFIDMVVKIVRDNGPQPPRAIDPEQQGLIDQAKKGEPTMQMPNGDTFPNPGYWGYKYIYGDPKVAPPGGIGGTTGKCTPSVQKIAGGVIETKCFK